MTNQQLKEFKSRLKATFGVYARDVHKATRENGDCFTVIGVTAKNYINNLMNYLKETNENN